MTSKQVQHSFRNNRMGSFISHREFLSERLDLTFYNRTSDGLLHLFADIYLLRGNSIRNKEEGKEHGSYNCRVTAVQTQQEQGEMKSNPYTDMHTRAATVPLELFLL